MVTRLTPLFSSVSAEWYTPLPVLRAVTKALRGIDLDPCADPEHRVPAERHFTETDDGLRHPWSGRVFCNPPYGSVLPRWVTKFVDEHTAGRMTAGILLCPARPDTRWFNALARYPRCYIRGRLVFVPAEDGTRADPAGFPSMLVYAGPDLPRFVRATRRLGRVYPGALDATTRSRAEKRAAVLALLANPEIARRSNRDIARRAQVSHTYVARLRETETAITEAHATG